MLHKCFRHFDISIHALREEGDSISEASKNSACVFLSTPSVRRATYHPLP